MFEDCLTLLRNRPMAALADTSQVSPLIELAPEKRKQMDAQHWLI